MIHFNVACTICNISFICENVGKCNLLFMQFIFFTTVCQQNFFKTTSIKQNYVKTKLNH